jgi:hypothetical protein
MLGLENEPLPGERPDRLDRNFESDAFGLVREQDRAPDVQILHLEDDIAVDVQKISQRAVQPNKTQGMFHHCVRVKARVRFPLFIVILHPAGVLVNRRPEFEVPVLYELHVMVFDSSFVLEIY